MRAVASRKGAAPGNVFHHQANDNPANSIALSILQGRHVARRYGLPPQLAALIADFAFNSGRCA
jgi:hypothetical protein